MIIFIVFISIYLVFSPLGLLSPSHLYTTSTLRSRLPFTFFATIQNVIHKPFKLDYYLMIEIYWASDLFVFMLSPNNGAFKTFWKTFYPRKFQKQTCKRRESWRIGNHFKAKLFPRKVQMYLFSHTHSLRKETVFPHYPHLFRNKFQLNNRTLLLLSILFICNIGK